jgi:hypothetical protein
MKKIFLIPVTVVLVLALVPAVVLAGPGIWEANPDTDAEVSVSGDTITMGVYGDAEGDSQGVAAHGATLLIPPCDQVDVDFTYDLYTWDSYWDPADPSPPGSQNWYDSFSISTSLDKYWNLSLTDPLNGDPLDVGYLWGGEGYGDGSLENTNGSDSITMSADDSTTNYLNVVLDTATAPANNGAYPSWGEIEITKMEFTGLPDVTKELVDAWPKDPDDAPVIDLNEMWFFTMIIDVYNPSDVTVTDVMVKDNLGGDLGLADTSTTVGTVNTWTTGKTEKVHLTWDVGDLAPGQEESLKMTVYTDVNTGTGNGKKPGHQEWTSEGEHCLNSGATAKGVVTLASGEWDVSDTTDPICIKVPGEPPVTD